MVVGTLVVEHECLALSMSDKGAAAVGKREGLLYISVSKRHLHLVF